MLELREANPEQVETLWTANFEGKVSKSKSLM